MPHRFLGRMTDPSGNQVVYLQANHKEVPVTVGTVLDSGHVVEAITADEVRLVYPPLRARASIPIPPAPDAAAAPAVSAVR